MGTQYLFRQTIQVYFGVHKNKLFVGLLTLLPSRGKGGGATNCVENKEKERR